MRYLDLDPEPTMDVLNCIAIAVFAMHDIRAAFVTLGAYMLVVAAEPVIRKYKRHHG